MNFFSLFCFLSLLTVGNAFADTPPGHDDQVPAVQVDPNALKEAAVTGIVQFTLAPLSGQVAEALRSNGVRATPQAVTQSLSFLAANRLLEMLGPNYDTDPQMRELRRFKAFGYPTVDGALPPEVDQALKAATRSFMSTPPQRALASFGINYTINSFIDAASAYWRYRNLKKEP